MIISAVYDGSSQACGACRRQGSLLAGAVAVAPPQPMRGWVLILGGGVVAFYLLFVRKKRKS